MAHYAFLDENNIVTEVIVGKDEGNFNWEMQYGMFRGQACKQTSYNTYGGKHKLGGTPFRGNYAGIGYIYDATNDVFYAPQPYPSWTLNESTWLWEAPIAYPTDGKEYIWDESITNWKEVV
jgi:hypothetical protein